MVAHVISPHSLTLQCSTMGRVAGKNIVKQAFRASGRRSIARRLTYIIVYNANAFAGKHAVVTAAGQGIGRASALLLAREGAQVLATDLSAALLAELASTAQQEGLQLTTRRVDVTVKEDIEQLAASIDSVDILFNCAGWGAFS